jgi:hypothetical protein
MVRRALVTRKNLPFVSWVAVSTGMIFLVLAIPLAAAGAFVVGVCSAFAARRAKR